MTSSRDKILNKLREAQKPFPDAPPRPQHYLPVALVEDMSPEGLLKQFSRIVQELHAEIFVVEGDEAACDKVIELLKSHNTTNLLAWDFKHIPVQYLESAIKENGIAIHYPEMHDEFRRETIETIQAAQAGLTGADVAIAATGTMVVSTGPGKGRLPTVLAPVHIAVITLDQIVARLEDWLAGQRAQGSDGLWNSANVCFISGPSKTADIEMQLIYGVHGPGIVQVVVKK
ncbi:MAG: lactate utilization protein [Anaerolineae bacterium]|nr:lactate utilization protein [Anaerolineae bacterium]